MILSIEYPPISAGIPVFGIAQPSWITLPRLCPLIVSTTTWQSFPAVNPGPTPITNSAASIVVPRFFFASIASTTTSALYSFRYLSPGSTRSGIYPFFILSSICSGPSVSFAITCSTSAFSSYTALENAIVRRTVNGTFVSVIIISNPHLYRRYAIPVARSPAPLIKILMRQSSFPFCYYLLVPYRSAFNLIPEFN